MKLPVRSHPHKGLAQVAALLVLALLAMLPAACSRREERASPPASTTPRQTFQGGPAAHPNDWCAGHGVPESQCTRCNPELIPQFKARHDWCEEHGVPESQCAICHPELISQGVVPPRPRAGTGQPGPHGERDAVNPHESDAGLAPGTTVRLASPRTAERVGIETVAAATRPLAEEVSAPVRITFDPRRVARVSARVPGVVRTLAVTVGTTVRSGDPLLTLESAAAALTRADLAAGRTRVQNAELALTRARTVHAAGAGTQAEIERAQTELAAARANVAALAAAGALVGTGAGRLVQVVAPRAGVVVAANVAVGAQVTTEEVLLEVADLSQVWALLAVPDHEAARLQVGQAVTIEMDGFTAPLTAALTYLAPTVDSHTRTVEARVELPNPEGRLRANAFGRARIAVTAAQAGVVVPRDALQRVAQEDVIFVERAPAVYEARVVEVALRTPREVQLQRGVQHGERVVTTGGFELKTELLRESIGAGCCDDDG